MVHGLYFANLFLIFYMVGAVSTFSQLGRIIDGAAENESFGAAVSISRDGNIFIMGSSGHSVGNISIAGNVRVYTKNRSIRGYFWICIEHFRRWQNIYCGCSKPQWRSR